jgi:hypothetical protein
MPGYSSVLSCSGRAAATRTHSPSQALAVPTVVPEAAVLAAVAIAAEVAVQPPEAACQVAARTRREVPAVLQGPPRARAEVAAA